MSISLKETRLKIANIVAKLRDYIDSLEESDDKDIIEEKIRECENEINYLEDLIENDKCINDVPEPKDDSRSCKYCSGCIYCQDSIEFDIADEF